MRPLRLFLDGFGSYRQPTEADFSDVNFFALTGPTGSGKSTLIDGLCFALYGTVPRWGKENVIAHALAPAASACRVGLVFEAGGNRYAAVRALARDKRGQVHTREARLDLLDPAVPPDAPLADLLGAAIEHLAEGPDPVKAKVQDILGLTYDHFTQSVLLPQGRFADFLQTEPSKRQELLVELLAFGVYKKIGQQARERARLAADRARLAQEERAKLADATAEAEERAAARERDLGTLRQAVDDRLRALGQRSEQARQAAEQAEAVRTQAGLLAAVRVPAGVAGLADRITAADQRVAARAQQADDAAEAEDEAERARGTLPEKAHVEALARGYEQQRTLTTRLQAQQEDLTAKRDAYDALASDLEAAEQEAGQARAARDAAQQAHAAYALAEGLRPGEPCPVCLQPVTTLPGHATPPGLDQVRAAVDAAEKKFTRVREARDEAGNLVAAADGCREDHPGGPRRGGGGARRGARGARGRSARSTPSPAPTRPWLRPATPRGPSAGTWRRRRRTARTSPTTRPRPGPTCAGPATRWWVSVPPPSRRAAWQPPGKRWPAGRRGNTRSAASASRISKPRPRPCGRRSPPARPHCSACCPSTASPG